MNFYIIFMNLLSLLCEPIILIGSILLLYKYSYIKFNQIVIFSLGFCFVMVLKHIIKRPRPYMKKNIINKNWIKVDNNSSFPSGHTYCAFMLYFILKHNNIISNKFIVIPILIAMSRIGLKVHYISDVIGGLTIALINYKLLL
jgi:undecaprenyl-diphosphatase